jgi:AraC family transcriptional regulator
VRSLKLPNYNIASSSPNYNQTLDETEENDMSEPTHRSRFSTNEAMLASPRAIHLSEDFEARSVQPEHYAQFRGVGIYHVIQPPSEFELVCTHHILSVQIDTDYDRFRQVSHFAGQKYYGSFSPFSFLLLPAKTSAYFCWNKTDESVTFTIEPIALQQIAIETDCLNPHQVELRPIVYDKDPKLEFFTKAFKEEMQNNTLGGQIYSESLANLFLIHLLRHYCVFEPKFQQYRSGLSKRQLKQALDYIKANLDRKLTLEAIAQQLDISLYYFCKLFAQSMGISPYKYILQQRVERAKQLLKEEKRAIIDIALECGFANQTHLNKHFHKLTGMTPKVYRNG